MYRIQCTTLSQYTEQTIYSSHILTYRSNSSGEPVHWLVQMKNKIRQKFNTYLALTVFLMLLSVIITVLWAVPVDITQNQKIASIEARLAQEMELNNKKMQEQFNWLEQNSTARISELVSKLNTMQQDAEAKISELERNISQSEKNLAVLEERLRQKEQLLDDALVKAAMFEQQHNMTIERVSALESSYQKLSQQLDGKTSELQVRIEDLEKEVTNTTARTGATEVRVYSLDIDIATINTTKATREDVDELTDRVEQLDTEKADRTELQVVSANLTSLAEALNSTQDRVSELERELTGVREELHETDEKLDNTTAKTVELEYTLNSIMNRTTSLETSHQELSADLRLTADELRNTTSALKDTTENLEERLRNTTTRTGLVEMRVHGLESAVASLNVTKASKESVNVHVTQLDREKVDRTEFEVLSANLSLLAEASSTAQEEIQQELNELADSTLNETHYHELHEAIASKASQTDLEALASSTVRTETFLQTVESIQNTILQLQWNITLNFTHQEGRIQEITRTLLTKAGQAEVTRLSGSVESLEETTVDRNTFQELETTVEGIQRSKADKTDLNQLDRKVTDLKGNSATKTELRTLENKLTEHISSSNGENRRLSSDIRSNSGGINSNSGRITALENSSSGLTPSQLVIAIGVSLTLFTIRWTSFPL